MRLPIRIGQGQSTAFNLNAVDFDGSTEYMANTTAQAIGITNAFSVSAFVNITANNSIIIKIGDGSTSQNLVYFFIESASGDLWTQLYNSSGPEFKRYTTPFTKSANTHLGFTWDGTTLTIYVNGSSVTPTKVIDNAGTMIAANRKIWVGSNEGVGSFLTGKVANIAIWNTALSSTEMGGVYNSGNGYKLDLRNSNGGYTSTSALVHQWAPGKDGTSTTTMGTDYVASGNINIGTNAVNISSADIVTF